MSVIRQDGRPAVVPRPTGRGIGCPPADVGEVRRWLTGHASPGPGEPIAEDLDRVENEVNEIRWNGKPCAVCGAGRRIAAAWRISERWAKRLGLLEPRILVVVVAACPGCSAAAGAGPRLESRLLRRWRRAFRSTPG